MSVVSPAMVSRPLPKRPVKTAAHGTAPRPNSQAAIVPSKTKTRQRLVAAAKALAQRLPADRITVALIARQAKVSWPTARRHLGNAEEVREFLLELQPNQVPSETTSHRLLEAASQVFATRGYAGTNLDEVGKVAGMTKGAIYWHFQNKEALFLQLMRERDLRMVDWGKALVARAGSEDRADALLFRAILEHVAALARDEAHLRLYAEFLAASRDKTARSELAKAYERQRRQLIHLVASLREEGVLLASAPVETIAQLLLLLFDGFVALILVEPKRMREPSCSTELVRVLERGLGGFVRRQ